MLPQRSHQDLVRLISGAYQRHKITSLAIVLAVSKLLLTEVRAALPSLARPLHRLVKKRCWDPGRRPAQCCSGWQGCSKSVACLCFIHNLSITSPLRPGCNLQEKLEIRFLYVCFRATLISLWGPNILMKQAKNLKNLKNHWAWGKVSNFFSNEENFRV